MIRRIALLLVFCLLIPYAAVTAEESGPAAQYTAITLQAVTPQEGMGTGKKLQKIRTDATVEVLEYGDTWCLVHYRNRTGYVKTRYLYGFVSLDAQQWSSPQYKPCKGYVILDTETLIKGGKFSGLNAAPGTLIAVCDESLSLPVWRGSAELPAEAGSYTLFVDWQTAEPGDMIAGFTTYYNERTGRPLQAARQYNIALGCERITGQVVQPDDTFSFNALCAPYKLKNGYKTAKNISHAGKGPGGGICQVSTTLYNAVLALPLQITAWAAHRPTGVSYIPRSFDAAVGSTTDLAFRNDLPYPIRIEAMPQDGAVTVVIRREQ